MLFTEAIGPVSLVIQALNADKGLGYVPIGVFDGAQSVGGRIENVPVIGKTDSYTHSAPVAILAMPTLSRHEFLEQLDGPLSGYRTVVVIPDLLEAPSLWVQPRDLQGILGLEITRNLLDPLARFTKRSFELILTLAILPVWFPLSLLIGLFIWIQDRGMPIYIQERIGYDGRPFKAWKFRTMRLDAEATLEKELEENPLAREGWEKNFKLKDDPRITGIGRMLRKTSLDELPQLLHVLRGEMSLVGPRPLPEYHYQQLPERVRRLRDRVRPGMTGLWQVSGRSKAGTSGMARWDTYYVQNWSFWLDIVILVRTTRAVAHGHGAY